MEGAHEVGRRPFKEGSDLAERSGLLHRKGRTVRERAVGAAGTVATAKLGVQRQNGAELGLETGEVRIFVQVLIERVWRDSEILGCLT